MSLSAQPSRQPRIQPTASVSLRKYIETNSKDRSDPRKIDAICDIDEDAIAARVFREYGAVFAAAEKVETPPTCIFTSEDEVAAFQKKLDTKKKTINGVEIELQEEAMEALMEAIDEADERGLRITPLDGAIAGRRSFADTLRIWNSRFIPALDYWVAKKRITRDDANRALRMPIREQIAKVVEWESRGIYFSTNKDRSIFSSVAPPGTSQHLSMLAFDIEQDNYREVRAILNKNGWYQTVLNDTPHFTFLGLPESELPKRGLRRVVRGGHVYWVPLVDSVTHTVIVPSN